MREMIPMKKCGFKHCRVMVPAETEACDNCLFELHVEIRRLQGISREAATIEYQRGQEPSRN